VAAALFHQFVIRDGTFGRMLPRVRKMRREIVVAKTRPLPRSLEGIGRDLAHLHRGFLGQQSLRFPNAAAGPRRTPVLFHVVEQDHRAITRRTLGFKIFRCARILLASIELMHMIAKGQMKCAREIQLFDADQFYDVET
jgi:transposase-like protein